MSVTESLPEPATARLQQIPLQALITLGHESLVEFEYAVDEETTNTRVVGVGIVGSVLTTQFVPYESDFDFYFITTTQYSNDDGFWRYVNDETAAVQMNITEIMPEIYSYIDCLGTIPENLVTEKLREPSIVCTSDSPSDTSDSIEYLTVLIVR